MRQVSQNGYIFCELDISELLTCDIYHKADEYVTQLLLLQVQQDDQPEGEMLDGSRQWSGTDRW